MILLYSFLEKHIDQFERIYAERYFEKKGFKHDFIYFGIDHKFTSDGNEINYECFIVLAKIDHSKTTKTIRIFEQGSFDTCFCFKKPSEQELISKMQQILDDHEAIS